MTTQHISPDGLWRWDGTQWVANPQAPAPAPVKRASDKKVAAIVATAIALVLAVAVALVAAAEPKPEGVDLVAAFQRGMELDPTAKQVVLECMGRYHDFATLDIPPAEEQSITACAYASGASRVKLVDALDFYIGD